MKCIIIYFSLTGNTRLAAIKVKNGIMDSGHECELLEMRDFNQNIDLINFDILGFMAPVHAFSEPTIFKRFLKKLPSIDKPAFIGATAASSFGNFYPNINEVLVSKGINVFAKLSVIAPPTYIPLKSKGSENSVYMDSELQKAFNFGQKLINEYEDIIIKRIKQIPKFKKDIGSSIISILANNDRSLRFAMGTIKIEKESCTKCGKCVDNCAWDAIVFESKDSYPKRIKNKCGGCYACINICPEGALWNISTKEKPRYIEPSYEGYLKTK